MILRITKAAVCGPHRLALTFNSGEAKIVDLSQQLFGRVFEPLKDPAYFARAELDPVCGTVVWPNGADFAPEALLAMSDELQSVRPS
jgi:hypothetical protein